MSAETTANPAAYLLPEPRTPRERRAFIARGHDGTERIWHATAREGRWEADVEDWWVFSSEWTTVGEAVVTIARRRTSPGSS